MKKHYRYVYGSLDTQEIYIDTTDAHEVIRRLFPLIDDSDDRLYIFTSTPAGKIKDTLDNRIQLDVLQEDISEAKINLRKCEE